LSALHVDPHPPTGDTKASIDPKALSILQAALLGLALIFMSSPADADIKMDGSPAKEPI
jgi:hypothetical protein